ncbi:MAG: glucosamine/fructose-6-phosphate aminotransferase, glucosamine-fructose-6-phosphate aminotransferase (isomerizing) [Candidatus Peregrinibacteria bacterium GW2011_GWF2_39_17]|nr:MAG: glucosamine/fructose-6-phosphate aminotransferase, glucosamine-fructose-6-phosphate aminotransferase (isomerizing) [Candidatus Peregrinibacteria bacterium GW2011_GWF2_39_17]HCW32000.1 glutamine--fructose-6-phosphate transaminase (isomerizing) [Candidatus Peregrinibacteria bacterium]
MCGIFGYLGPRNDAAHMALLGLKNLEYRGYDSWGVACKTDHHLEIEKHIGKISEVTNLKTELEQADTHLAIGHSRWATHGGVTENNAHPHLSQNGKIAIVHNGIIENYLELREELSAKGFKFVSETDTETIGHLIEFYYQGNFEQAFAKAIQRLQGRYAVLAIHKDHNLILAARKGSPLIVGVGSTENEFFIGSDVPAFLQYTNRVMYLDDDQMVIIGENGAYFLEISTKQVVEKRIITLDLDLESAEKGSFPHFMIKEIMEQKETIQRAINQDTKTIEILAEAIRKAHGTFFIGCGTAGKVALAGSYLFSRIAKKHVNFTFGSEFASYQDFLNEKALLVCISQSGETADTLEAIEVAKKKGVTVASIVNVESSTMARTSDIVLPIKAGPEKAVASTKATTSQLAILTLLAYATANRLKEGQYLLVSTAGEINDMLNPRYEDHIRKLADQIKEVESMYIIGKGLNYAIALEAAIKLQEVSYIHAEGFAGGELKHGPIALISQGTPCIAIVANDETKADILGNAMEVKARGGYIIGISPDNSEIFDYWIKVPDGGNTSPIVNIIPIQILAYHLAIVRKNNPDMPRNLAKSVTVK